MPFTLTTFDAALQAKLNTASVSLSAQDYLLLTANAQVPANQLINSLPSQASNSGKVLTTNGSTASWTNSPTFTSLELTTIYVGAGALSFNTSAALTSAMAVFNITSAINSYGQLAVHNATASSSTDVIAYANNGTDSDGWIDMGITGATFNSATYGITGPHDGYIFMSAPAGTTGAGNLVIATGDNGTENKIVFAAGGYSSGTTQMEITPDVNVHIEINTPSTSSTTGALTVVGGVGVQGDMNIAGDVSIEGTITFGGAGTTVETANLSVTDPFVFVGTNNQADIVDLAFIGEYASSVSPIATTVNNKALTSNVATLTTSAAHNYLAGDVVTITGVDATFNGVFNIIAVPTATTFTYAKTASNVTSAAVSPTGTATVNARRKFAGVARDASDGVIKAFKDATTKPTSTIDFSEAGLAYADMRVAGLTASSLTVGDVSSTEIGYLDGVTSAIQTQLNAKAPTASPTFTGTVTVPSTITSGSYTYTLPAATATLATTADISSAIAPYAPLLQTVATPTFSSNAYTLQSGDKDKVLLLSNGSTAGTVNIPTGTYSVGTVLTLVQTGSGQITIASSGTLQSQGSKYKLNGQYASAQVIVTATNTFLLIGNLAA